MAVDDQRDATGANECREPPVQQGPAAAPESEEILMLAR